MKRILYLMMVLCYVGGIAQKHFPTNGVADERPSIYAFTNATIFKDYQTKLENATLLIENGKVTAVGTNVTIPEGTPTMDLDGKFIYPAFVDPYTNYGQEEVKSSGFSFGGRPQFESKKEGAYGWNEAVKAEFDAVEAFTSDKKTAKKLRKHGFGTVVSFRPDGIVRGSSVLVNTGDEPEQDLVIKSKASAHFSFSKGSSKQNYPSSIMGMAALIRQTYYDAEWYRKSGYKEQTNQSLEAFNQLKGMPSIFEANSNKIRALLADKLGDEFGVQYIIKGNGDEYQRIEAIKSTGASFIIPLNFPDAYDVEDPLDALEVSLQDLKHWELAPSNPYTLASNGIEFAFTANGLKDHGSYLKNIRKSIKYGLSESQALKAMTYTPAKLVRSENSVGSLNTGMHANFLISSGNLFDKKSQILQTWVSGKKYEIKSMDDEDLSGKYQLSYAGQNYDLEISGQAGSHKAKIAINDTTDLKVKLKVDDQSLTMSFSPEDTEGIIRLTGWISGSDLSGSGIDTEGKWIEWEATRNPGDDASDDEEESGEEEDESMPETGDVIYPFTAYGWVEKPEQETILFKNATVWTLEGEGKIEDTDVLVSNGKIREVGQDLSSNGAREIDATGMHITPGIIDEHSHIALSGVNEGSHAITAEVRQYDAVNSEDNDIYRQLAGGVVAAQLLHGSANPIGGQSALIKFRWGGAPSDLRIKGADEYIKFALGENVKQSNWGPQNTIRFPQTRMGVEQVYVDAFTRAVAYDAAWKKYNSLSRREKESATQPRRDLQLEALAEIVNKGRFITCHSYVQSEINMLMKVAEQFNFSVNTFTHILEGYKVADKMAEHGAGGSTFSDWWAYKFEVREAIPYNAALMNQAGVTVALNSDNGEMARRLNQEAAKTIKYGNMSEIEALKTVTLNPAKLLHLDDRMGSIKAGKDADLVVWTEHPLSVYAKARMTLVDGIVYFDQEKDMEMREWIRNERTRLINKMREVKKSGGKTQKYRPKQKHRWDCEEFVINEK